MSQDYLRATVAMGLLLAGTGGCGSDASTAKTRIVGATGASTGGAGLGGSASPSGVVFNNMAGTGSQPARACGDGKLTSDEACDDGNQMDGDGCSANCRSIESGFSCPRPGQPCQRVARCGDGVVTQPEPCDDGNAEDGDGCASNCKLEAGFKCSGSPSVCSPTVCGDGMVEGTESCDDGNTMPFDGCGTRCQSEPDCRQGACRSRCGDGLVLGEECDDGNNVSGDGCSSDCKVEPGFVCEQDAGCEKVGGTCVVRADVIYRDFTGETTGGHPDFMGCDLKLVTGLVDTRLDAQGKPVLLSDGSPTACITSKASFAEWYRKVPANLEVAGIITLFDNGAGGFVNRYGPNGEPWIDASGQTYDGSPLFFPLDGKGKTDPGSAACINSRYGSPPASYVSVLHDFHFTSEVTHWFKYDSSRTATLAFTGDDDVWVFLNGVLAVDLGGVHHPTDGMVTVGQATAAQFGLEDGKVYPIKVFQAERKICGSSFRLTLTGFDAGRSACRPVCGDGIVSLGEECDDGVNDGGYNECAPGCKRGEFCGDGIVQAGEDCDDGNTLDGDGCGSACRVLDVR